MGRLGERARGTDGWMHAPGTTGDRRTVICAAALTCIVVVCVLLFSLHLDLVKVSWGSVSGLAARAGMLHSACDVACTCARQLRC